MLTFEVASKVWEQYLTDDVNVNLHMGVTGSNNLPKSVIGGALPGMKPRVDYSDFRNHIHQDATSSLDRKAIQSISETPSRFKHERFYNNGQYEEDYSQNLTSSHVNMTTANAKALGLVTAQQKLDGYIVLSDLNGQGVQWDASSSNTVSEGQLDLLSTAMHEIGHALGFVSGVDQPGAEAAIVNQLNANIYERVNYATTLDQFRYSASGTRDITYGSQRSEKYFSVDGGRTSLAKFSTGADRIKGGDGFQASHWKQDISGSKKEEKSTSRSTSLVGGILNFGGGLLGLGSQYQTLSEESDNNTSGIMDPTLSIGQRSLVTDLDLKAFDAIGWDLSNTGANQAIDFTALRSQARQELAQRAGKSWQWMSQNQTQAAAQLSEVRVVDIVEMAINSQVYDLSWMNQNGGASFFLNWANHVGGQSFWLNWWNNGGGNAWWQMMGQAFEKRGLFSTIDPSELNAGSVSAELDTLTGLSSQQPVVAATAGDAVAAPPTVSREQFEGFESFATTQTTAEASGSDLAKSYGSLAPLSLLGLGGTGHDLLGNGLTSLGKDQLQTALGLTPAFGSEALLG